MLQEKLKPNRKKNLSSKIIVDEYDHLIKNSKLQPNYDSFLDPPLSPHFLTKESKLFASKQESSESEYSMHQQHQKEKQCQKCGDLFNERIYESHINVCEKKAMGLRRQENERNMQGFNKKDQYNLLSMNQSIDPDHKLISARSKAAKKQTHELIDSRKGTDLKKSTSKKSINSQEKRTMNRPSSSTRNKLQIKGHQNLKQKILNKLQATRKKNPESKDDHTKRISSSQNKSNSRPKSINKNVERFNQENKKFSTINSSSVNKKKLPNQNVNYEFNRSEIMNGFNSSEQRKKEKTEFLSKANIKQEKKQTLKKKNINYNNSFVMNQPFNKEKEKNSKLNDHFNFTENNSYLSGQRKFQNVFERERENVREQLRKEGLFRRDSSSSASKRKFQNKEYERFERERQKIQQKPHRGMQQVNDEYYFFQNHPSTVPSHYIKRQIEPHSRYEHMDPEEVYQNNSSNIIRSKLGINKNLIKTKEGAANKKIEQRKQMETEHEMTQSKLREHKFAQNQQFEREMIHRRANSSRENNRQEKEKKTSLNTEYMNGEINRGQRRGQQANQRNQPLFPIRQQNQQTRQRPQNPMGNDRQTNQRRQNMNRPQNRPQPRITNQRMNSSHNQSHRQQVPNQQRERHQQPHRNNRTDIQNQPRRPQTQQQRRRPQQQQSRRQDNQQARRAPQHANRRRNLQQGASRRQPHRGQGSQRPNRIHHQTLNFISNTLNQQFEVMNGHFNLLNNIFSNFSNIVNVNITASNGSDQNPTTFVFRNHGRRRHRNHQSDDSHSEYSDFSSDFSQDQSFDNQTDYDEDEYYYEEEQEENSGMTEHQINSIPVLRYNKEKHGSNQCTICLVELKEKQPFKKLFCQHVFHTECIDEWLKRKNACPVCRDQMGVRS